MPNKPKSTSDWARIDGWIDADIERMAKEDPDNPASAREDWTTAFIGLPPPKVPVNALKRGIADAQAGRTRPLDAALAELRDLLKKDHGP